MNDIDVYMSWYSKTPPSQNTINLHEFSLHYVNKHYKNCTLITNSISKKYFSHLNFTNITTDLDEIDHIETKVWAIGKIFSYKSICKKEKPFLHLDYDVFLKNKISKDFLLSPVFVQNEENCVWEHEINCTGYNYNLKNISNKIKNYISNPSKNDKAYNMGIFGGKNLKFINEYAETSIKFILDENNKKLFEYLHDINPASPSLIVEQYLLWKLAKDNKILVNCYIGGNNIDELKQNGFNIGYVHLMGSKNQKKIINYIDTELSKIRKNDKYEPRI